MICVDVSKVGVPCLARVGRVLTEEEANKPELVEEREYCRFKKGDLCEHTKS
jgi:hypothetical protein